MVTLSVTRSRIAHVLARAADDLGATGWNPDANTIIDAIDRAAGFVPGNGSPDAEATSLAAWEALRAYRCTPDARKWETRPGLTQAEVLDALRAASEEMSV